jgi:hypothetical protein
MELTQESLPLRTAPPQGEPLALWRGLEGEGKFGFSEALTPTLSPLLRPGIALELHKHSLAS